MVRPVVYHVLFKPLMALETAVGYGIRMKISAFFLLLQVVLSRFSVMADCAHKIDRRSVTVFSGNKYFVTGVAVGILGIFQYLKLIFR